MCAKVAPAYTGPPGADEDEEDETTEADQVLKMFQVWGLLCRLLGRYAA